MSLRLISLLLLLAGLLAGCQRPLTEGEARATAVASGCWPYGVPQPQPTPTLAGLPTPTTLPGAAPTVTPTAAIYPTCLPIPGTPTVTPVPTLPPTPIPAATPQVPAAIGGPQEIGDVGGLVTAWGRMIWNPVLAAHPQEPTAAIGWISYGSTPDALDGQIWVRVQQPSGVWASAQTVNREPVAKFYGGLGLAFTPDGTLHVIYGGGGNGEEGDDQIFVAQSPDLGATWSEPVALPTRGSVRSLTSDESGGLHLLLVMPERDGGDAAYAYLPSLDNDWQVTPYLGGMRQVNGWLSLLEQPDGTLRRVVLLNGRDDHDFTHLSILWSDDGQRWARQPLEMGRFFADEQIVATSLLVVPRGAGLIAAAWAQTPGPGHARGGAFAVLSTDGGTTWSRQEIIAQHYDDGRLFDDDGRGLPGGFEPALVYDATTDRVVASWVEEDIARRGAQYGAHLRTFLASRPLDADATWQDAITPDRTTEMPPPLLADWGLRGALWGMPSGRRHWLVTVDERNDQHRVDVRPLRLSALLDAGQS
ncbi:MAG TPA: sialidase family protein [Herpetosiphonaceae bacterium]